MTYTPNVPQGNQTIAQTTDPIRNNFQYINAQQQVEHSFNGNLVGLTNGAHKLVSMPNVTTFTTDPPPIPAGSNGVYYVTASQPAFFNGTKSFFSLGLQGQMVTINGVTTLGPSTTQNIPGPAGNVAGYISVFRGSNADGTFDIVSFFRYSDGVPANLIERTISLQRSGNNTPYVTWNGNNLAIINDSSQARTFHYVAWWYPTV